MDLSRDSGRGRKRQEASYKLLFAMIFLWILLNPHLNVHVSLWNSSHVLRRENKSVICIKPLSSWLPTHVVANVHKWEKAKGVNTPRTVSNGGNTIGLWKREKALDNNLPQLCCVLPSAQQINLSASALCLSNLRRIYKHKKWKQIETTHSRPHTFDSHIILTITSLILI